VCSGQLALTVASCEETGREVIDVPSGREIDWFEGDLLAIRVVALVSRRGAGKVQKKIIEAAVFLNDEDDVGDGTHRGAKAVVFRSDRYCIGSRAAGNDCEHRKKCGRAKGERLHKRSFRARIGAPLDKKEAPFQKV